MLFSTPLAAAGTIAAAASVPIIIHLLNRRRYRIVDWAAMRFLLAAEAKCPPAATRTMALTSSALRDPRVIGSRNGGRYSLGRVTMATPDARREEWQHRSSVAERTKFSFSTAR